MGEVCLGLGNASENIFRRVIRVIRVCNATLRVAADVAVSLIWGVNVTHISRILSITECRAINLVICLDMSTAPAATTKSLPTRRPRPVLAQHGLVEQDLVDLVNDTDTQQARCKTRHAMRVAVLHRARARIVKKAFFTGSEALVVLDQSWRSMSSWPVIIKVSRETNLYFKSMTLKRSEFPCFTK